MLLMMLNKSGVLDRLMGYFLLLIFIAGVYGLYCMYNSKSSLYNPTFIPSNTKSLSVNKET